MVHIYVRNTCDINLKSSRSTRLLKAWQESVCSLLTLHTSHTRLATTVLHSFHKQRQRKVKREIRISSPRRIDIVFLQGLERLRKNTANIEFHHDGNNVA